MFDCTSSGLQHLAAIIQDYKLGVSVNLVGGMNSENPMDIYEICATWIKDKIAKDQSKGHLRHLNITRDITKKCIMTISYNITVIGIRKYIEEFFDKEFKDGTYVYNPKDTIRKPESPAITLTNDDIKTLTNLVYNSLFDIHPNLKELVSYFKEMSRILNHLNQSIV